MSKDPNLPLPMRPSTSRRLATCLLCLACFAAKAAEHPNVVMIILDDMNGFSSLDQYAPIRMPHLDALRGEAVNFTRAVCSVSVCNPSRAAFLSGLDAYHTGAYLNGADVWNKPGSLSSTIQSLPEFFTDHGYDAWAAGKVFHSKLLPGQEERIFVNGPYPQGGFGPFPDEAHQSRGSRFHAIQEWTGPDSDFPDIRNADAAIDYLNQEHRKPFFLVYGLWRPHAPYTAPRRFFEGYRTEDMPLPPGYRSDDLDDVPAEGRALTDGLDDFRRPDGSLDEHEWRRFLRAYCANSTFADWNLGRVIDAVDASPCADNTIVIVFSDNGFNCGRKDRWEKATLWEPSAYAPLLVRLPGGRGAECPATVSLVDLYPTLQELCGLPPPRHHLDGRSFAAQVRNPSTPWTRPSLTIYGKGNASIRDDRFRFIHYRDGTEELYDLESDPYEFTNLADRPEHQPILLRLRRYLPTDWAPSWGGRWEVGRPGEPKRYAPDPEYKLPDGYETKSES